MVCGEMRVARAGREAVAAHPSHHPSRGVLGGRRRALAAAGGRRDGYETAAARAEGQGGRVRARAATLTCQNIRRDAKRHLSERGGEGEEKVKAEGLRGLCAARGYECGGGPLTNVTKNLDPPRAGRLLLEKKRAGSGRR